MSDLISRQATIKAIENLQDCYNGFSDTYDKACIIGVIEEVPPIEPIKHGHWIRRLDTRFGRLLNDIIICSNCNIAFSSEQQIRRSYCPNCGAKMDERR